MATNDSAMVIPGHGTVFHAPPNTATPANPLTAFTLEGAAPSSWESFGHTSKQNLVRFERDAGTRTGLSTWLRDNVRYIQESADTWRLGINALQVEADVMDMAFNGELDEITGRYLIPETSSSVERALYVLCQDDAGSLGFYIPNTEITLGDVPQLDTTNFLEIALTASIKSVAAAVLPLVGGKRSIMAWDRELFKTP